MNYETNNKKGGNKEMIEQKQKYEDVLTVKELHDTLSKMIEEGYGNASVFSKDPEHPSTYNAVYGWGTVYYREHNYTNFYLILGIDEVE